MPIHDWTRVTAGTFHDFHLAWIAALRDVLNNGVLPADYYAMAEQIAGHFGPDVLALEAGNGTGVGASEGEGQGGPVAVARSATRIRYTARAEMDDYVLKQRTLVIRHATNDRVVALVEIVSPGNKSSRHALRTFVQKAAEALYRGYHLLIIDLFPPGPRDPQGIHGAVWAEISDENYQAPLDQPLTLAAYAADRIKTAYVEPVATGELLPDMPLFLEPEVYVDVPLESTYLAAWHGVPRRWRQVLAPEASR
ncbi:MAG: DUF4058 family protein [Gemmataceae bacterium]|nr:DUF4058 family protein [Gemmataceae bacterium]